ncbi:MAG: hypothetical protein J6386_07930 [Candidatus Synoicihabitans palmerolidicus]|nr:hypothetical protein [Candidatus Synoicihabitans palmerolidicus]
MPYRTQTGQGISSKSQANTLLQEAQKLITAGAIGVALTYSANYGQTKSLDATYRSGGCNPKVVGIN